MTLHEKTLDLLLKEIEDKLGAYSQDYLTHAENVINVASENAKEIRTQLVKFLKGLVKEAENEEIHDVKTGLYWLLGDLGVNIKRDAFGDYYLGEDEE